jgi:hypothetical protein
METITGNYVEASFVNHGFVRAPPDGTITTFEGDERPTPRSD